MESPLPFPPFTSRAREDILAWINKLSADKVSSRSLFIPHIDPTTDWKEVGEEEDWKNLQLLLYYLKKGQPYQQAKRSVKAIHESQSKPNHGIRPLIKRCARTSSQSLRDRLKKTRIHSILSEVQSLQYLCCQFMTIHPSPTSQRPRGLGIGGPRRE